MSLIYGRRISSTPNSSQYEVVSTYKSLTRKARHHRAIDTTGEKGIPYWIERAIDPEAEEQFSRYISWRYCFVEERFDFKMHVETC